MNIRAHGHPKHGCHMLTKAVELLGVPCSVEHIKHADKPAGDKSVFIKRDPRNALVSWLRFRGITVAQGTLITAMQDFDGMPYAQSLSEYAGWLSEPGVHVVEFEALRTNEQTLRDIAAYLGVPYLDDAFQSLPGGTFTWTGSLSDYRPLWTPAVQAAWDEHCPGVLAAWGY